MYMYARKILSKRLKLSIDPPYPALLVLPAPCPFYTVSIANHTQIRRALIFYLDYFE